MGFHDRAGDGETQPGPAHLATGGEKGLGQPSQVACGNAAAFIPESDGQLTVVGIEAGADMDPAIPLRQGLQGVQQHIDEDLLQLLGVALHQGQIVGHLQSADVGVFLDLVVQDHGGCLQDLLDVHPLGQFAGVLPGHMLEVLYDAADPIGIAGDLRQQQIGRASCRERV